jgi:flagellar biosynthetic protein FliQ
MTSEMALQVAQAALACALQVALPAVVAALVAGVVVGLFQAATQIQDAALSFVPKMIAVGAAIGIFGGWMLATLVGFAEGVFRAVPMIAR